jgi:hypothetical protein
MIAAIQLTAAAAMSLTLAWVVQLIWLTAGAIQ